MQHTWLHLCPSDTRTPSCVNGAGRDHPNSPHPWMSVKRGGCVTRYSSAPSWVMLTWMWVWGLAIL